MRVQIGLVNACTKWSAPCRQAVAVLQKRYSFRLTKALVYAAHPVSIPFKERRTP